MTEPEPSSPFRPFAALARTPEVHFDLWYYAAVLKVIAHVSRATGSQEAAAAQFPFLAGYIAEVAPPAPTSPHEDENTPAAEWCRDAVLTWEADTAGHLPLRALRTATALTPSAILLLMCIGLGEEDVRFGHLFAQLQGTPGQHRPTLGLLTAWAAEGDARAARSDLRRLLELGTVRVVNPDAPRAEQAVEPWGPLWDALRGEAHPAPTPWSSFKPTDQLLPFEQLLLPAPLRASLASAARMLRSADATAVILRGPQHNGRRAAAGAVARSLGLGVLEIDGPGPPDQHRWRLAAPLAAALGAMPVLTSQLTPGETLDLPAPEHGRTTACAIVLGRHGGVRGAAAEPALSFDLPMPDAPHRAAFWRAGLGGSAPPRLLDHVAAQYRMSAGNIVRAAALARSYTTLDARTEVAPDDVRRAARSLNRQALDTLATRVDTVGDWSELSVPEHTARELEHLRARCLHRERLAGHVGARLGARLNPGVRALFTGPSGTGKTLAARLLAADLVKDLYRLDLAGVVNKYIGETEKHLERVFAAAEELDVMLLLDEADALLTRRTDVNTANDRYANLETNYLLQRLEDFEGIVILTTNAGDRIDPAFRRRMDVSVEFRAPDAAERWAVWQSHLPDVHRVDADFLAEVAGRCALTGGQIRNAVLHASLVALDDAGQVGNAAVDAAVRREYRKAGAVCPLRGSASTAREWPG